MSAIVKKLILVAVICASAKQAVGACKELDFIGFKRSTLHSTDHNGIKVYIHDEKMATLAIQCQALSVSKEEALNDFGKVGQVTKIHDDLYFNEWSSSGVKARNYLMFGPSVYQISLVINSKSSDMTALYTSILADLSSK